MGSMPSAADLTLVHVQFVHRFKFVFNEQNVFVQVQFMFVLFMKEKKKEF